MNPLPEKFLEIHNPASYTPFPKGKELEELSKIAFKLGLMGMNNIYLVRSLCRLVADLRCAPGREVSNKQLHNLTWTALQKANARLAQPPAPAATPSKQRVKITTQVMPSETQMKELKQGKPLTMTKTVEVYYRRR